MLPPSFNPAVVPNAADLEPSVLPLAGASAYPRRARDMRTPVREARVISGLILLLLIGVLIGFGVARVRRHMGDHGRRGGLLPAPALGVRRQALTPAARDRPRCPSRRSPSGGVPPGPDRHLEPDCLAVLGRPGTPPGGKLIHQVQAAPALVGLRRAADPRQLHVRGERLHPDRRRSAPQPEREGPRGPLRETFAEVAVVPARRNTREPGARPRPGRRARGLD